MTPHGTFCTGVNNSLEIQSLFTNQKLWGKWKTLYDFENYTLLYQVPEIFADVTFFAN